MTASLASPLSVLAVCLAGLTLIPVAGAATTDALGFGPAPGVLLAPGFAGGYLFDERLHHRIHFGTTPTRYGRARLQDHMRHHSRRTIQNASKSNSSKVSKVAGACGPASPRSRPRNCDASSRAMNNRFRGAGWARLGMVMPRTGTWALNPA